MPLGASQAGPKLGVAQRVIVPTSATLPGCRRSGTRGSAHETGARNLNLIAGTTTRTSLTVHRELAGVVVGPASDPAVPRRPPTPARRRTGPGRGRAVGPDQRRTGHSHPYLGPGARRRTVVAPSPRDGGRRVAGGSHPSARRQRPEPAPAGPAPWHWRRSGRCSAPLAPLPAPGQAKRMADG